MEITELIILLLATYLRKVLSNSSLNMLTVPTVRVKSNGDRHTFNCEFKAGRSFDTFENTVIWKKTQLTEKEQIYVNSELGATFTNENRFKINFTRPHDSQEHYNAKLTITDMKPEDSGNYTCEINNYNLGTLAKVTHFVMMRAPVESLIITTKDTQEDLEVSERSLKYSELGENRNRFKCISKGGYPKPELRVYIACPESERGVYDITEELHWSQTPKLVGKRGLRKIIYYSQRWNFDFEAEAWMDGCEITCAVNLEGVRGNPAYVSEVQAVIHVNYAPRITCYNTSALPGDRNVALTCDVKSKPVIESAWWILGNDNLIYGENNVDVDGEFWTLMTQTSTPQGNYRYSLYMREAKYSSFRRYEMVAENSVGVSNQYIDLAQKIAPSLPPYIQPFTDFPGESARVVDDTNASSCFNRQTFTLIISFITCLYNLIQHTNNIWKIL